MPCMGLHSDYLRLRLSEARQDVQPTLKIKDDDPQVCCPECEYAITSDFSWCPQCGARTQPYRCEYCRGWVPIGWGACPQCGASIN